MDWIPITNLSGLCFEIAGAILVARVLLSKTEHEFVRESMQYWGYNPVQRHGLIQQKWETYTGVVLLVLGFALQAASLISRLLWLIAAAVVLPGVLVLLALKVASYLAWPQQEVCKLHGWIERARKLKQSTAVNVERSIAELANEVPFDIPPGLHGTEICEFIERECNSRLQELIAVPRARRMHEALLRYESN